MHLLGSERYVKAKLENLSPAQLSLIREAFVKNSHPRFKKEFASTFQKRIRIHVSKKNSHPRFKKEFAVSRHQPFGKTSDYIKGIENAGSEKLARLIKIVGMLLQTKVYLFWGKPEM